MADLLARGGVLGIPTESSYGLGVDPWNRAGVEAVYRIKQRERGKPLPVVVAEVGQITGLGIAPDLPILGRLARLWPAPLTVVLPLSAAEHPAAAAGTGTLAVRLPAHEDLRRLLVAVGPLTATSANRSGEPPSVDPDDVAALLEGEDAALVEAGRLAGGPPSTLVEATGRDLRVLRRGSLPERDLAALLESRGWRNRFKGSR